MDPAPILPPRYKLLVILTKGENLVRIASSEDRTANGGRVRQQFHVKGPPNSRLHPVRKTDTDDPHLNKRGEIDQPKAKIPPLFNREGMYFLHHKIDRAVIANGPSVYQNVNLRQALTHSWRVYRCSFQPQSAPSARKRPTGTYLPCRIGILLVRRLNEDRPSGISCRPLALDEDQEMGFSELSLRVLVMMASERHMRIPLDCQPE